MTEQMQQKAIFLVMLKNELETSYTSYPAGNKHIPSLTKNTVSEAVFLVNLDSFVSSSPMTCKKIIYSYRLVCETSSNVCFIPISALMKLDD